MEATTDSATVDATKQSLQRSKRENTEIVALEEAVVERERIWFLKSEVPFVTKELAKVFEECVNILKPPVTIPISAEPLPPKKVPVLIKSPSSLKLERSKKADEEEKEVVAKPQIPLIPFEDPDHILKGHTLIEGWQISEAEIFVKSSKWNKHGQFRTTIPSSSPVKLIQMHNAYNFLKLGQSEIQEIEMLIRTNFFDNEQSHKAQISEISAIVERVSNHLKNAMEEFLIARKDLFPTSKFVSSSRSFEPRLPADLILDFNFANKELVVLAHLLHIISPPKQNSHSNLGSSGKISKETQSFSNFASLPSALNQAHQYTYCDNNTYRVEIVDSIKATCVTTKWTDLFSLIDSAYKLCMEMRDKIIIFL